MTLDASWRQILTDGFGAFLDRPLNDDADADAAYGAYYWAGNFLQDIGFASDARWVDPEALAGRVLVEDDNIVMYDVGEAPLRFDAAASIFVIGNGSAMPHAFATELSAAAFPSSKPGEHLVLGRDLGALAERHKVDLTDSVFEGAFYVLYPRIASDGTLVDALRVAAAIGEEPDSLIEFDGEPAEEWAAQLARVEHPGLHAHLSFCCQDAGEASLSYVAEDELTFWGLTGEGCSVIAAWDETENQVEVAVVQLAGALAATARTVSGDQASGIVE